MQVITRDKEKQAVLEKVILVVDVNTTNSNSG